MNCKWLRRLEEAYRIVLGLTQAYGVAARVVINREQQAGARYCRVRMSHQRVGSTRGEVWPMVGAMSVDYDD